MKKIRYLPTYPFILGHVTTKNSVLVLFDLFILIFFHRLSIGPFDFLEFFIALRYLIYLYGINNKSFYNTMHILCIKKKELEVIFMKHYAPNRCEPSIEVIMKIGVQWDGGRGRGLGGGSGWM